MCKKCFLTIVLVMLSISPAQAFLWDSGHYEVKTGDVWIEGSIINSATATITGGYIGQLHCHDTSEVTVSGGSITALNMFDNSILEISGGTLMGFSIDQPGPDLHAIFWVDTYAYDSLNHRLTGTWFNNNGSFQIEISRTTFPQITFVPEPLSVTLLGTGMVLFLNMRRNRR
jgi:hypothetical protein